MQNAWEDEKDIQNLGRKTLTEWPLRRFGRRWENIRE